MIVTALGTRFDVRDHDGLVVGTVYRLPGGYRCWRDGHPTRVTTLAAALVVFR